MSTTLVHSTFTGQKSPEQHAAILASMAKSARFIAQELAWVASVAGTRCEVDHVSGGVCLTVLDASGLCRNVAYHDTDGCMGDCPGCAGEASKSVGVALGCSLCAA